MKTITVLSWMALGCALGVARAQGAAGQSVYPCFISSKDWFDEEAKPGFQLELLSESRYRVTLNGQKQEGKLERGPVKEDVAQQLSTLYDSAQSVSLLEVDGSLAMAGLQVVSQGKTFILLKLKDRPNAFIRCGQGDVLAGAREKQAVSSSNLPTLQGKPSGQPPEVGAYRCTWTRMDGNGKPSTLERTKYDFNLFAGGEALATENSTIADGSYTFDAKSGTLEFTGGLLGIYYGSPLRYFKDGQNRSVVQWLEKDYNGEVESVVQCSRTGQNTAKSPAQQRRDAAATAAARTFRVAAGKGVQPAQIEALGSTFTQDYTYKGLEYNEYVHLFLKDGTVYQRLEVPPSDFDAATSKKKDPQNWSQWKREGGQLLVRNGTTWKKFAGSLEKPVGEKTLSGELSNQSSYDIGFGGFGGTVRSWYLALNPDGSFEKANSSLSSTGTLQSTNGFSSSAASFSDKKGTTSSASSNNTSLDGSSVGTASVGSKKNNEADFTGTYRIDGFTLELKYKNGEVERHLFYRSSDKFFYLDGSSWSWTRGR